MDKKELELLIENFPDKPVLRRYKTYIENKNKSFTEIHNKYLREVRNAIRNGYIWVDIDELDIIADTFRKSVRKIEDKGIESVFSRKDIVKFAMFINPICINDRFSSSRTKEYIKKFIMRLETGKNGNYKFVFGERFGSEETFRKELLEHIAKCKMKISDITTLKNKNNIYIIDAYTKDNYHLHIKGYKYDNIYGVTNVFEDIYESKYLQSYMAKVEKGIIDYSVMNRRRIISNQCRKKIKRGLGNNGEVYLMISPFSAGIIVSA